MIFMFYVTSKGSCFAKKSVVLEASCTANNVIRAGSRSIYVGEKDGKMGTSSEGKRTARSESKQASRKASEQPGQQASTRASNWDFSLGFLWHSFLSHDMYFRVQVLSLI